jgi:hypothetical protein
MLCAFIERRTLETQIVRLIRVALRNVIQKLTTVIFLLPLLLGIPRMR